MSIERWSQKKRTEGYFGEAHCDWEVEASQHIGELYAELDKLRKVVDAAKLVCDGWVGQNAMGERWHDAEKDVDALLAALADLDKGE